MDSDGLLLYKLRFLKNMGFKLNELTGNWEYYDNAYENGEKPCMIMSGDTVAATKLEHTREWFHAHYRALHGDPAIAILAARVAPCR